jgi:aryl carrier-like protein
VAVRAAGADSVPASVAERARAIVSQASPAVRAAGVATLASLALADPAHADTLDDTAAFLKAFWEFRTGDPASFVALTVLPILGPYLIFQVLIKQKVEVRKEELAAGGWIDFMAERGLDADMLTLVQLNAFAAAAEKDLLDDGMVTEFVRQLELNEKWKKSTIDVEDPRLAQATQRARAEKILAMKEARAAAEAAKETANN